MRFDTTELYFPVYFSHLRKFASYFFNKECGIMLILSDSSVIRLSVYMVTELSCVSTSSVYSRTFTIASICVCMYVCIYDLCKCV